MLLKLALTLLCCLPLPRETELMVEAGKDAGARTVVTGTLHPDFIEASEEHVAIQARNRRQGHPGWRSRYARLQAKHPNLRIAEIASESWLNQTPSEAARDAFTVSWPASPGHWAIANKKCVYYGTSMKRSRNGITYTSMVVGY